MRRKKEAVPVNKKSEVISIRFDMKDDEIVRAQARKEYELAKNFKLAKLPLYKFFPASEISARKQFNLAQKTDLTIVEIQLTGKQETDFDRVNQAKDFLSTQDNIEMMDDKEYRYDGTTLVHRFLVHCK